MISIVCVFNDADVLEKRLLKSLANQSWPHEVITVDNRDSRFPNAAAALNWGAARTKGDWLLFAHQDVALLTADWLEKSESCLRQAADVGWCGVAGNTFAGKFSGMLLDRSALLGEPLEHPSVVQTLDECLIMHRQEHGPLFDEQVPGWHAYGVEACCRATRQGQKNYVLPLAIWHDSKSTNLNGLEAAHRYVWDKHRDAFDRIATTCGVLPTSYDWQGKTLTDRFAQLAGRLESSYYYRVAGHQGGFTDAYDRTLEALTADEPAIDCLHTNASYEPLEARAFVPVPQTPRRVSHRFTGWLPPSEHSRCTVIAPDLASELDADLNQLLPLVKTADRLIVCLKWSEVKTDKKRWHSLERYSSQVFLTRDWFDTRFAIIELDKRDFQ